MDKLKYKIAMLVVASLCVSCSHNPPPPSGAKPKVEPPVDYTPNKTASTNQVAKDKKPNYIESHIMIERLGSQVTIRVPSSLFFIGNSANISPEFNEYIHELVVILNRYHADEMNISVKYPVVALNNTDYQIANNQADRFVTRLEQYMRSRFSSGSGSLVVKSSAFSQKVAKMGNFFELILNPNN